MKITKAVIPAAGFGTRVLPATKNIPKEMFPIVDKPTIQFIVEEAVNAGITDILIITNRGKGLMEDHFDRSPELEQILEKGGKTDFLEVVKGISELANISFIRQKEMKGLGHAVLKAKSFVGNEPFAVLFGDGVIISKKARDPSADRLLRRIRRGRCRREKGSRGGYPQVRLSQGREPARQRVQMHRYEGKAQDP